jgi:membrane protein DedA with SNARE-associated domain
MSGDGTELVSGFILKAISFGGYGGIFGLMVLESAGAPVPSEIVLPFAGFLVSGGRMNLWLVATVGALACNAGSAIAYEIARYGGRPLIERWGRYLLLTHEDLARARRFFERFGGRAVLIARLLPVVRGLVSYPAGVACMGRARFHIYTFIGSWPWCLALAAIGKALGQAWANDPRLHAGFHWGAWVVIVVCAGFLARFVWMRTLGRRR